MNNTNENSKLHQRLLIWSYILGSISALLGSLAAVGSALEQNSLKYPNISDPIQPLVPKQDLTSESQRNYFDL